VPLRFLRQIKHDERQTREKAALFVAEHVRPTVDEDDAKAIFRRDLFDAVTQLGLHAYSQPVEWGGGGGSHRCYYAFLEELGRGSLSLSVSVGVTNLVQGAIAKYGTDAQKDEYLRPLTSGKYLGAFSLSEPQSGSDASALRLAAKKETGGYRINGNKIWCSNAGHADLYLVMARTGEHKSKGITSFLIPAKTEGLRIGKYEKKLGLRASTLAELIFEECFIPDAQRLGEEGQGFSVALSQLDAGRISIAAAGIAATSEALETAWRHLQARATPEFPFAEGTQHLFAEYFARLLSVKALMGIAAVRRDKGHNMTVMAASLKLLTSELALQVCHDAVLYMGYDGVRSGSGVERNLRDSKALQIVEGTNQIQRLVLARNLDAMLRG
jgi:alkylation response protein AidB-like acyl-CoA dehydrogenase